jgi:hypothetical protein
VAAIQEIAPLKAELAPNKDIVFIYTTNTSSPEKSYRTLIPGVRGEHYRLSDNQYNYLAQMFKVYGIPHYAIINKQGEVVDQDFKWTDVSQVKKQLMTLAGE